MLANGSAAVDSLSELMRFSPSNPYWKKYPSGQAHRSRSITLVNNTAPDTIRSEAMTRSELN